LGEKNENGYIRADEIREACIRVWGWGVGGEYTQYYGLKKMFGNISVDLTKLL
jgi:hypothetical protein